MRVRVTTGRGFKLSIFAYGVIILLVAAVVAPTVALAAPSCGAVILSGKSWLGGNGVDVHSNGAYQTTGTSCADAGQETYNLHATVAQFGYGWQCVELVNRLYSVRGWFSRFWLGSETNGGAKYMYTYTLLNRYAGVTAKPNGLGYIPVPGDLIVHTNGLYGHISVVDFIDGTTLYAVEQNNSVTGRTTYTYNVQTGQISKTGATIVGLLHATRNSTPPAIKPATASALLSAALLPPTPKPPAPPAVTSVSQTQATAVVTSAIPNPTEPATKPATDRAELAPDSTAPSSTAKAVSAVVPAPAIAPAPKTTVASPMPGSTPSSLVYTSTLQQSAVTITNADSPVKISNAVQTDAADQTNVTSTEKHVVELASAKSPPSPVAANISNPAASASSASSVSPAITNSSIKQQQPSPLAASTLPAKLATTPAVQPNDQTAAAQAPSPQTAYSRLGIQSFRNNTFPSTFTLCILIAVQGVFGLCLFTASRPRLSLRQAVSIMARSTEHHWF